MRLADRPRPARPRRGGARRPRRGELADGAEPRAGPAQDGGVRRRGHECRDRPVRALGRGWDRGVQAGAGAGQVSGQAYLLLEDGTRFDGDWAGAEATGLGEVVFNTSMSGYQEAVTDPSYAGQIIVFTYPLIGNYGVAGAHMESDRIHTRAVIMREGVDREDAAHAEAGWLSWLRDCGVPALTGVDTRALVRHIRDKGAMRGGVFGAEVAEPAARERLMEEPPMTGRDLARDVTPSEVQTFGGGDGPLVLGIDTGIKSSIVRNLRERGVRLELHPCTVGPEELMARDPDAVFLANGPGDPAALDYVVDTVRELVGQVPVWGICLGHQLLCRAVGLETFKLPFGHRGANHPVKDLETGRIEITSQNHGFAVLGPSGQRTIDSDEPVRWETDFGAAELQQLNLYDRTVEGLVLRDVPASTVQYHPEAGPGPHDAQHLFDRFLERLVAA
ncbi:MAG: glutamine-hydrolyzing carbamoyl-phosphate synthase small subunit [Thermoleophilaceae bacterium]|nr:glutamine-hydrolyzing carbamoyl-phosphate synthase small subunit [Thermoleophilaceae bacterium]